MELDGRHASDDEARRAIAGLQDADFVKLMLIARFFHRSRGHGTMSAPEDLVQIAITKTLDGTRRWNKTVGIMKHLDRTIESVSGHLAEKRLTLRTLSLTAASNVADGKCRPLDARLCADEDHEFIARLFGHNRAALNVLRLKADGLAAAEIRRTLDLTETQYDTITKSIRRALAQRVNEEGRST